MNGKSILITGGSGSFGKKYVETILARYRPTRLIVYSRDELKQFEMQQVFVMALSRFGLSRLPGQAGQSNQGITISRILGQGLPITGLGAFVQAHGQCLISSDCGGLKVVCAGRSCFANARRSRWQRLGTGVGAVRCCFVASF